MVVGRRVDAPVRILSMRVYTLWLRGAVVRALGLRLEIAGSNPSRCTVECDLGQVVHTHCPAPLKLRPYGAI